MATRNVWFRALLVSAYLAKSCFASGDPCVEVPFRLYKDCLIFVRGSVGPLEDLTFIIDTGATSTVISPRLAQRLQLEGIDRKASAYGVQVTVKTVMLHELSVGAFQFRMIPALVADLSALPSLVRDADALIGLSALKRTDFCIDYESKTITFGSVDDLKNVTSISFGSHLTVRLHVSGMPVDLIIDTGAMDLILFRDRLRTFQGIHRTHVKKTIQHVESSRRVEKVILLRVLLEESEWERLEAWLLPGRIDGYPEEVDGVVGPNALGLSRIAFDMKNSRMSWLR